MESKTTLDQFFTGLINLTRRNCTTWIRLHYQSTTLTAPCQHLNHTPPHVLFLQRRFTTPRSDQAAVPEPAFHPHLRGASTNHDPLPPQGLPSSTIANLLKCDNLERITFYQADVVVVSKTCSFVFETIKYLTRHCT